MDEGRELLASTVSRQRRALARRETQGALLEAKKPPSPLTSTNLRPHAQYTWRRRIKGAKYTAKSLHKRLEAALADLTLLLLPEDVERGINQQSLGAQSERKMGRC